LEGYTKDNLNAEMNNLINYTNASKASGMPGSTKIFNSLWISNSFKINDKFEKDTQKYYNSDTFRVDFSSPAAIADMNSWINMKTAGLLPKAISNLEKNTSLSIFNVLYFNGKWTTPFVKASTVKEDFLLSSSSATATASSASASASTTAPSGKKIKVDMMNAERMMNYYEDKKVKAGIFDYYNGSMMIIVPQGNFDEYISNFSTADIENYNKNKKYLKAKIKVPKFKIETKNSLNTTIKELGMLLPFDPAKADLSGINSGMNSGINSSVSEKGQKLAISQIMHDCVVKVDEEGTEAAALTSVILMGAALMPETTKEFYVDKPFVFVIQGNGNLMLFIGKVENPLGL
jgi:serpin B